MFRKLLKKGRGWIYNSSKIATNESKKHFNKNSNSIATQLRENTHQRVLHLLHAGNFSAAKKLQDASAH